MLDRFFYCATWRCQLCLSCRRVNSSLVCDQSNLLLISLYHNTALHRWSACWLTLRTLRFSLITDIWLVTSLRQEVLDRWWQLQGNLSKGGRSMEVWAFHRIERCLLIILWYAMLSFSLLFSHVTSICTFDDRHSIRRDGKGRLVESWRSVLFTWQVRSIPLGTIKSRNPSWWYSALTLC